MRNPIKPSFPGGPLSLAPFLSVPPHEHGGKFAARRLPETRDVRDREESRRAASGATRDAAKTGYGVLAFWIVVAALTAARIAFLEPGRIEPTSSLFGTTAVESGRNSFPKN
jgi:hypothetical protein